MFQGKWIHSLPKSWIFTVTHTECLILTWMAGGHISNKCISLHDSFRKYEQSSVSAFVFSGAFPGFGFRHKTRVLEDAYLLNAVRVTLLRADTIWFFSEWIPGDPLTKKRKRVLINLVFTHIYFNLDTYLIICQENGIGLCQLFIFVK